jgi:hypothetical protein
MDRDMRLTGIFRAQTDNPEAPLGFEVNNPWKVCHEVITGQIYILTTASDGGPDLVKRHPQVGLDSAESCTYLS